MALSLTIRGLLQLARANGFATTSQVFGNRIMRRALERHGNDPPCALVNDIVRPHFPGYRLTEPTVEAMLLQLKGPYSLRDTNRLINFLAEDIHGFSKKEQSEEIAALKGYVAIDLAKFAPGHHRLKPIILRILETTENNGYFLNDRKRIFFDRFVSALYLIDKATKSNEAQKFIDKYGIDEKTLDLYSNEVH